MQTLLIGSCALRRCGIQVSLLILIDFPNCSPSAASCLDKDGTPYEESESHLVSNCQRFKACHDGRLFAGDFSCLASKNFECKRTANGYESCVCKEGFSLDPQSDTCIYKLIPRATECTLPNGAKLPNNKAALTDRCMKKHVCLAGTLHSAANRCRENAYCGIGEDDRMTCMCKEGFRQAPNGRCEQV